jgi:hypothetical protein
MPEHKKAKQQRMLWETKLPGIKYAILPSQTTRPNPLVFGEFVFASIFSPGAVCAVKRKSGELLWLNQLDSLGSASVFLHGRSLYAKSSRTLYALDPKTGRVRWEFSPTSDPGESIYSSPTVRADRVFIGDRCGYLHCLDAKTGSKLWRRLSSNGPNNQVNSTALVLKECVISANNQGIVVCRSPETGESIWRQKVDGACIGELLRLGSDVIVAANSLYAIDLKSGIIRNKWSFPQKAVRSVAVVGSRIALILGKDFNSPASDWEKPSTFNTDLLVLEGGREVAKRRMRWTPSLRGDVEGKHLYAVTHSRLNVFKPSDASLLTSRRGWIAPPEISGRHLFGLSHDGVLFSERLS